MINWNSYLIYSDTVEPRAIIFSLIRSFLIFAIVSLWAGKIVYSFEQFFGESYSGKCQSQVKGFHFHFFFLSASSVSTAFKSPLHWRKKYFKYSVKINHLDITKLVDYNFEWTSFLHFESDGCDCLDRLCIWSKKGYLIEW